MTAPVRIDHGFTADLRAGRLNAEALDALAGALDLAIDKPADAAAALGLERSRQEQSAQIAARNEVLREAGGSLPAVLSLSAKAALIRSAFLNYRAGAWRRDRLLDECPMHHRGTLREFAWRALRLHDGIPEARTIRRILGREPVRRPTS
ncbi:hypothetical protein AAE026_21970 [Bradyrhizobium sp. DN5]|uniref:hypothetical protein n=1 Tax=Bradyrhizobium sp. DN5 TaxID=3056950 RepID=UPI003525D594